MYLPRKTVVGDQAAGCPAAGAGLLKGLLLGLHSDPSDKNCWMLRTFRLPAEQRGSAGVASEQTELPVLRRRSHRGRARSAGIRT
jgi:hypothetical protein